MRKIQIISLCLKLHFQETHTQNSYRATQFREIDTMDSLQNVCLESLIYDSRSALLMHYETYS